MCVLNPQPVYTIGELADLLRGFESRIDQWKSVNDAMIAMGADELEDRDRLAAILGRDFNELRAKLRVIIEQCDSDRVVEVFPDFSAW